MKKGSLFILSLFLVFVVSCGSSGSSSPTDTPTGQAYVLPSKIEVLGVIDTSTNQNIVSNIKSSILASEYEVDNPPFAMKTYEAYYSNKVQSSIDKVNLLLQILKDGNYSNYINKGSGNGNNVTVTYQGKSITSYFEVERLSSSETMDVKMWLSNNMKCLLKVTKSVNTGSNLPYGEFEAFMNSTDTNNPWQYAIKVSEGQIECIESGSDYPEKTKVVLDSATTGKAYCYQDLSKEASGKSHKTYYIFNNSEMIEETNSCTNSDCSSTTQYYDRTKKVVYGNSYQLYTSDGSLYDTLINSAFTFTYDNVTYNMTYVIIDGKKSLCNQDITSDAIRSFPFKNGTAINVSGTTYYAVADEFEITFSTKTSSNLTLDKSVNYDGDFITKSIDIGTCPVTL